ncbi:hypothetical protein BD770DRAFT_348635, partial [Pilaira anomala]
ILFYLINRSQVLFGEDEISLLETSGKFLLNNKTKYGSDHIKVNYGTLSIFNALFQKYWIGARRLLRHSFNGKTIRFFGPEVRIRRGYH